MSARDWFAGSILVMRAGKVLYQRAVGLADREAGVRNRLTTRYDVASMNKMMTAVSVLQLVQDGRLRLDDTVGKWLPDYPQPAVRSGVTVRHLLTHTSGLGSYWNARFAERRMTLRTTEDYLALFSDEPVAFAPGTRWQYSNAGYIVLGAIVERVTGTPFDAWLAERVLQPAGMSATGFWGLDQPVPDRAISYTTGAPPGPVRPGLFDGQAPPRRSAMDQRPYRGLSAGGGYSTVEDLVRFAAALQDGRLLPVAWRDSLWIRHAARPPQMGGGWYGFGFGIEDGPAGQMVGHNGGQPGSGGELDVYLDRGVTVAILTNVDPIGSMRIGRLIGQWVARLD